MAAPQNTIALIFDFDDTLTDDSTTLLLSHHGIDPADFWSHKLAKLVKDGWDPAPAYLHLILQHVGKDKELGLLNNAALRDFGKECVFYQGLPELFTQLKEMVATHELSHPSIEFYVISGGLEEIILGSSIAGNFSAVRGCRFAEIGGVVAAPMNIVTFTEKTRYLFEINKGMLRSNRLDNPYAVNNAVEENRRRIPFSNMIYVGDGLTDVPCFSLLQSAGGKAFGVFDATKKGSPKKAWELIAPRRVSTMNAPKYQEQDDLGALLRMAVDNLCVDMDLRTRTA